jgi:hypothetical protein
MTCWLNPQLSLLAARKFFIVDATIKEVADYDTAMVCRVVQHTGDQRHRPHTADTNTRSPADEIAGVIESSVPVKWLKSHPGANPVYGEGHA